MDKGPESPNGWSRPAVSGSRIALIMDKPRELALQRDTLGDYTLAHERVEGDTVVFGKGREGEAHQAVTGKIREGARVSSLNREVKVMVQEIYIPVVKCSRAKDLVLRGKTRDSHIISVLLASSYRVVTIRRFPRLANIRGGRACARVILGVRTASSAA